MESGKVKKSSLKLNQATKVLNAMVKGFFGPEDANDFVEAYSKNISAIDPAEYELHFDCTELKVSSQEMLPMLTSCFEMYKKDGFKKIVFRCGANAGLRLQVRRVGNTVGLTNYEIA